MSHCAHHRSVTQVCCALADLGTPGKPHRQLETLDTRLAFPYSQCPPLLTFLIHHRLRFSEHCNSRSRRTSLRPPGMPLGRIEDSSPSRKARSGNE